MRMLLVNDDEPATSFFEAACRECPDLDLAGSFGSGDEAFEFIRKTFVEFALLDLDLMGSGAGELGRELQRLNPGMVLMYMTAQPARVADVIKMKADYCMLKPCDRRDFEDALERARLLVRRMEKRLRITTFGSFEVFVDGCPLHFGNHKARELFALCVDKRGAALTMEEAIDVLWPERPYDEKVKRLYRKAVKAVKSTLESRRLPEVFHNCRGRCHILREEVECDLYRLLDGGERDPLLLRTLRQKGYMFEYSWAEERRMEWMRILNDEQT